jgi:hypothetical protein
LRTKNRLQQQSAFAGAFLLLLSGLGVHRNNRRKRQTYLVYELDETSRRACEAAGMAVGCLAACRAVWRLESRSATADWKRNAGAQYLVKRHMIGAGACAPPRVKVNVAVPSLDLGQSQLYFLPDTILYRDRGGYGSIRYPDFHVSPGQTTFIETGAVPSDSVALSYTWRYVNKDGGPDRRFNNNVRIPVLQLGTLTLTSSTGLNLNLNTSNPAAGHAFTEHWRLRFPATGAAGNGRPEEPQTGPRSTASVRGANARRVLGVADAAPAAEISAAYHRLAQQYHPDKVAGLAPEFQDLAGRKMREINAAYNELKASG